METTSPVDVCLHLGTPEEQTDQQQTGVHAGDNETCAGARDMVSVCMEHDGSPLTEPGAEDCVLLTHTLASRVTTTVEMGDLTGENQIPVAEPTGGKLTCDETSGKEHTGEEHTSEEHIDKDHTGEKHTDEERTGEDHKDEGHTVEEHTGGEHKDEEHTGGDTSHEKTSNKKHTEEELISEKTDKGHTDTGEEGKALGESSSHDYSSSQVPSATSPQSADCQSSLSKEGTNNQEETHSNNEQSDTQSGDSGNDTGDNSSKISTDPPPAHGSVSMATDPLPGSSGMNRNTASSCSLSSSSRVSSSLDEHTCRICWMGEDKESCIRPCQCSGSSAFVHPNCLRKWLQVANDYQCEICRHKYNTSRRMKPFSEWRWRPGKSRALSQLEATLILLGIVTPPLICGVILCTQKVIQYIDAPDHAWKIAALMTLVMASAGTYLAALIYFCRKFCAVAKVWIARNRQTMVSVGGVEVMVEMPEEVTAAEGGAGSEVMAAAVARQPQGQGDQHDAGSHSGGDITEAAIWSIT